MRARLWARFRRFLHHLRCMMGKAYWVEDHRGYDLFDHVMTPSPMGIKTVTVPHSIGCRCGRVFWEKEK